MLHTIKTLEKSQLELTITLTAAECEPYLQKTAQRISERTAIKGFRPGKAPYDLVKREVGEMAILQEALDAVVQKTYFQAITEEKLEVIGMPKIDVDKLAPGNDLVYRATVAILPKVKLPDFKKIKVEKREAKIEPKKVDETFAALRGMQAKEVIKPGPAEGTDKLTIDMDMLLDNVPVEGGQAKNYQVYLGEDHYVPGFNEQVKGMKEGDEKSFQLDFPSTHYQKHLAGRKVDFKVKAKAVYERQLPELNDEFAKALGQESVEKLRQLVNDNLSREAKHKADQQMEIDLLEQLIANTEFGDLPEILVDSERQKMFHELKRDLERNGVSIEQYLQDIKKGEKELFEDFKNQAEKRAKAALISRQMAKEQNITVPEEDIDKEIAAMAAAYKDDKAARENLKKREVRETVAVTLQNRKVMGRLRAQIVG